MADYFMGVDIGTSSTRAVLFNAVGMPVGMDSREYSIHSSFEGTAELNPDLVFHSTLSVIRGCMEKAGIGMGCLAGIGLGCQMHSVMAVDREGMPLTGLMTWADNRASAEADFIRDRCDVTDLYNRTGCRVQHPMYPISKILWLRNNRRDLFDRVYKYISIKEYVIYKLYGEFVVDYTIASCQGFYNIHRQNWDETILQDILGIDKSRLSEAVECTTVLKGMKPEFARILGIAENTPVIVGSGDGILANVGCGVRDDTSVSCTIGTSGAIRTAIPEPLLDPRQRTWCYSFTRDTWVAGGAINNGGIVLKWLRENFRQQFEHDAQESGESLYRVFDRYAAEVAPGSDGLLFLPYLMGERSPNWNAAARGIMYGLDYSHGRKHMIRAAMEGVLFRMYSIYEVISVLRDSAVQIRANGGYAKSDIWLKMQADIFNKEILVPPVEEASALGGAFLAMAAVGAVKDWRVLLPSMEPRSVIKPSEENHRVYRQIYEKFKDIYEKLYPVQSK